MKTLRLLTLGMLLTAATTLGAAAEEPSVLTVTVTAKRHTPAVERVPPSAAVAATLVLPTDMPEADIDFQLPPLGTPHAAAVNGTTS